MISKFFIRTKSKGLIKIIVAWDIKKIMVYNKIGDLIFENGEKYYNDIKKSKNKKRRKNE